MPTGYPDPIVIPPVGKTLEPAQERDMSDGDKTVHVPTPAGVDRQKQPASSTSMGAPGRGWGPNGLIPYWDLNRAIQQAAFALGLGMISACIVFAFGSLFGVFPLNREPSKREVDEAIEQAADEAVRRAFDKLLKEGWRR